MNETGRRGFGGGVPDMARVAITLSNYKTSRG